jgi:(S)-2-hydroxyglutarate dehydrogenase
MRAMAFDFVVIGGGIVGVATARELLRQRPGASLLLLEKEAGLARHQTGRNSGVIHAGVYYEPGSLKARLCREGAAATRAFCQQHGIAYEACGKLIVATTPAEVERLRALQARCAANGLDATWLDAAALRRTEERVAGLAALRVAETAIVDYGAVVQALASDVVAAGGTIRCSARVIGLREAPDGVHVSTTAGDFRATHLVACAGLMADRIARMSGLEADFRIVPFRGEYFRLPPQKADIVRHLIYPVPDPALPFLGVHLTRMIGGYVTVGPNAVFSWAREGYRKTSFDWRDTAEALAFPGFWRVVGRHFATGLDELRSSWSRQRFLDLCRRYCPELTLDDLLPHASGVRAQAVLRDGTLVHDFLVRRTARTVHVCNAPSPAATSALPIARHIASLVLP